MKLRKVITTLVIAAMLFWAPTFIPIPYFPAPVVEAGTPCPSPVHNVAWLPSDTAFAGTPCAFGHGGTGWVWGIFGCSAGIITAAMVANWRNNRQLTTQEAWTCGLLYWFHR